MDDPIHKPKHYNQGQVQAIHAIKSSMSASAFYGYLKGNVQKYLWRYELKEGLQDLAKAQWYLNRLVSELELVKTEQNKNRVTKSITEQAEQKANEPF